MNLVQSEIQSRLRQGVSQIKLAAELKISAATLNNILKGHRDAGEETLRKLGLARIIQYVYLDQPLPKVKIERANAMNGLNPTDRAALVAKNAALAEDAEILTIGRIQIAVRHSVNPQQTWSDFVRIHGSRVRAKCDAQWLEFCEARKPRAASPKKAKIKAKQSAPREVSKDPSARPPALDYSHIARSARPSYIPPVPAGVTVLHLPRVIDQPETIA